MIATIHALIGFIIGLYLPQAWSAFLTGWVSHYFSDLIPHWDYLSKTNRQPKQFVIMLIDGIALIVVILFLLSLYPYRWLILSAGVLGAILPDLLQFFYELTKLKWLKPLTCFHTYVHDLLNPPNKRLSFYQGLLINLFFILLFFLAIWG